MIAAPGLLLAIGFWCASDVGYFQHWTRVSERPRDLPGYLGTPGEPIQLLPPDRITSTCDFSTPEFSFLTDPPKDITDCVQELRVYADGDVRVTYVIDSGGGIWEWILARSAYAEVMAMISWSCSGLFIGIVVGLLAEGLKMYVDRRRTKNR